MLSDITKIEKASFYTTNQYISHYIYRRRDEIFLITLSKTFRIENKLFLMSENFLFWGTFQARQLVYVFFVIHFILYMKTHHIRGDFGIKTYESESRCSNEPSSSFCLPVSSWHTRIIRGFFSQSVPWMLNTLRIFSHTLWWLIDIFLVHMQS